MATPIKISNWETGIATSPHLGFDDMRNVEINDEIGVVEIAWEAIQATATADRVNWFVKEERNTGATVPSVFALDDSGNLSESKSAGSSWAQVGDRSGFGEGMVYWKDYIILSSNTGIDAYGPLSTTNQ